jgi:PAS domain S-box-containing protein
MSVDHSAARPVALRAAASTVPSGATSPPGRWMVVASALVTLFVLTATADVFTPPGAPWPAFWPASAVGVCLLATSSRQRWPELGLAVLMVATGGFVVLGADPLLALLLALGVLTEVLIASVVLVRGGRRRAVLETPGDLGRIVVGASLGALAVAVGTAVATTASASAFVEVWRGVGLAHATATTIVVATVLLVARLEERAEPRRLETLLQVGTTALVLLLVLGAPSTIALAALPVPVLLWVAWRLSPALAAVELTVTVAAVALATPLGMGPFGALADLAEPQALDLLVPAYAAALAAITLLLAVASLERRASLEEAVARHETFQKSISESVIGTMLLRPTPEGLEVLEANGPAADLLGSSIGRLRGRVWTDGLTERQRLQIDRLCHGMSLGVSTKHELEMHLRGSTSRWVRLALSWVRDTPDGGMVTVQLVDLTHERDLQFALAQERDLSAAVLDNAQTLILVLDRDGRILKINRAVEEMCGVTMAEVFDRPVWDVLAAPENRDTARAQLEVEGPPETEGRMAGEHDWVTATGERRTVSWTSAQLRADDPGSLRVFTARDVTEERRAQRLVTDVLDAATGTAIVGTDEHGIVTFFNPGAEQMLGYSSAEVVGRVTPQFFHDPVEVAERAESLGVAPGFEVFTAPVARTGSPDRRDWSWVRKDGQRLTVSVTVSPMRSGGGALVGYLAVAEDVTERARGEVALRQALERERRANERLEELDRIKSDFVASVSHELRTPMTSVLGFTQLLTSEVAGALNEKQQDLLERVDRNGHRLLALIEDLLTLSRIEAGSWEFSAAEVEMTSVVAAAMSATEDLLRGRELDVVVDLDREADATVVGDFTKLEQALVNLVANALKFTRDGGRVRVSLVAEDGHAVVRVADTGIGIDADEVGQVFDRFFRSSLANRAAIPGTGLGLTIVKSIIDHHGGQVTVTSAPGEGTEFAVRLPLAV